jgi:hypothetical protein
MFVAASQPATPAMIDIANNCILNHWTSSPVYDGYGPLQCRQRSCEREPRAVIRFRMRHAHVIFILFIVVSPITTGSSQEPTRAPANVLDDLARAEAKWRASKTEAYEFRFQYACNGLIPPTPPEVPPGMLIRVKDGESTHLRPGAVPVPVASELVHYSTVEKLFAFIRKAWTSRPSHMEVQYDQARGYPIRICVDPTNVSDDEFGFLITDFKVLSNAALPPSAAVSILALPDLSVQPVTATDADVDLWAAVADQLRRGEFGQDGRELAILDETIPTSQFQRPPDDAPRELTLMNLLRRRNNSTARITGVRLPPKTRLMSASFVRPPNAQGRSFFDEMKWERFSTDLRDMRLVRLSLPAFSEDRTRAIIYYSATGGFDDSRGAYMVYEKKQGQWTVVDYLYPWIT